MVKKMNPKIMTIGCILMLFMTFGCVSTPNQPPTSSQQVEQDQTEANQKALIEKYPAPTLDKSLERQNLIKRLQLLNDENKVFYVYLVSYGKVMAYYVAQGKVSSVNSYLTTYTQIVKDKACISNVSYRGGDTGSCYFAVEAPDLDGSYGTNGDGIFFFTTEGAYVEWNGEYFVTDYPLTLSTPPELVMNIDKK
jgi:hypothetical protein